MNSGMENDNLLCCPDCGIIISTLNHLLLYDCNCKYGCCAIKTIKYKDYLRIKKLEKILYYEK